MVGRCCVGFVNGVLVGEVEGERGRLWTGNWGEGSIDWWEGVWRVESIDGGCDWVYSRSWAIHGLMRALHQSSNLISKTEEEVSGHQTFDGLSKCLYPLW